MWLPACLDSLLFLVIVATPVIPHATAPHSWGQVGCACLMEPHLLPQAGTSACLSCSQRGRNSSGGRPCGRAVSGWRGLQLLSFCTHWPTVHKHSHLDHNKALPILSLTRAESHRFPKGPSSSVLDVAGSCETTHHSGLYALFTRELRAVSDPHPPSSPSPN